MGVCNVHGSVFHLGATSFILQLRTHAPQYSSNWTMTLYSQVLIHLSELLLFALPLQDGRWSALMVASTEGHEVVVEALLKGGATVDMQTKVYFSASWY